MKCYQKFVAYIKEKPLANKLTEILCQNPTACMQLDLKEWENGFEGIPCNIVETPYSVIYPVVKNLVDDSLGYLIRQQGKDGAWHLNFSFGDSTKFRKLESQFETHLTVLILAELERFRRIE